MRRVVLVLGRISIFDTIHYAVKLAMNSIFLKIYLPNLIVCVCLLLVFYSWATLHYMPGTVNIDTYYTPVMTVAGMWCKVAQE